MKIKYNQQDYAFCYYAAKRGFSYRYIANLTGFPPSSIATIIQTIKGTRKANRTSTKAKTLFNRINRGVEPEIKEAFDKKLNKAVKASSVKLYTSKVTKAAPLTEEKESLPLITVNVNVSLFKKLVALVK